MSQPPEGEVQRWTAKRKAAVVLDLVRGKATPTNAARQHGLTVAEIEQWKADFLAQGTEALRSHPRDRDPVEAEKQRLHAKIGELALEVDVLKTFTAFSARTCRTGSRECGAVDGEEGQPAETGARVSSACRTSMSNPPQTHRPGSRFQGVQIWSTPMQSGTHLQHFRAASSNSQQVGAYGQEWS